MKILIALQLLLLVSGQAQCEYDSYQEEIEIIEVDIQEADQKFTINEEQTQVDDQTHEETTEKVPAPPDVSDKTSSSENEEWIEGEIIESQNENSLTQKQKDLRESLKDLFHNAKIIFEKIVQPKKRLIPQEVITIIEFKQGIKKKFNGKELLIDIKIDDNQKEMIKSRILGIERKSSRPIYGEIVFKLGKTDKEQSFYSQFNPYQYQKSIRLVLHQLFHLAGFSQIIFNKLNYNFINSQHLIKEIETYYNCENQELMINLLDKSHWHRKFSFEDILTDSFEGIMKLSNKTLKIMKDLNFYQINFDYQENAGMTWGKNKKCPFFEKEKPCKFNEFEQNPFTYMREAESNNFIKAQECNIYIKNQRNCQNQYQFYDEDEAVTLEEQQNFEKQSFGYNSFVFQLQESNNLICLEIKCYNQNEENQPSFVIKSDINEIKEKFNNSEKLKYLCYYYLEYACKYEKKCEYGQNEMEEEKQISCNTSCKQECQDLCEESDKEDQIQSDCQCDEQDENCPQCYDIQKDELQQKIMQKGIYLNNKYLQYSKRLTYEDCDYYNLYKLSRLEENQEKNECVLKALCKQQFQRFHYDKLNQCYECKGLLMIKRDDSKSCSISSTLSCPKYRYEKRGALSLSREDITVCIQCKNQYCKDCSTDYRNCILCEEGLEEKYILAQNTDGFQECIVLSECKKNLYLIHLIYRQL